MSIRVSAESQRVAVAQSELAVLILKFADEHALTSVEILQGLTSAQASILKHMDHPSASGHGGGEGA